jgi:hypothetical protein
VTGKSKSNTLPRINADDADQEGLPRSPGLPKSAKIENQKLTAEMRRRGEDNRFSPQIAQMTADRR